MLDTSTATGIGSLIQSDCGDLRFTDQNGKLLPYFYSSGCLTTNTTVHVFMQNFPAGAQTIYIYYGNAGVANGTVAADYPTAASGVTLGLAAAQEVGTGPVGYWKFDEGQGTTANDAVGTVSGTLNINGTATVGACPTGSTAWGDGATGKYNSAAAMSTAANTDFTTVTSANTYPFSVPVNNNASWGGWFKPTSSINSQGLIDKVNSFRLYTDGSGSAICSIFNGGGLC